MDPFTLGAVAFLTTVVGAKAAAAGSVPLARKARLAKASHLPGANALVIFPEIETVASPEDALVLEAAEKAAPGLLARLRANHTLFLDTQEEVGEL